MFNTFSPAETVVDTSINDTDSYFEIYQIKPGADFRFFRFTDFETLQSEGRSVDVENYDLVYTDKLDTGITLEDIFTRFNIAQPMDFTGRSLSVSDIIVVHDSGDIAAYYVDSTGYKRIPDFLKIEKTEIVDTKNNANSSIDTSINDNEQAIRNGFSTVITNHGYGAKQKKFLERLESYAVRNNVTEHIVDAAFENSVAFHNTYGNKEFVSRTYFGRRLGSIEKEVEEAIHRSMARNTTKEPVTLDEVIAKFYGSDSSEVNSVDGTWSINYTDGVEFAEVYHNGNAACAVILENDVFSVKPYEELSAIPAMVTRAMKEAMPETEVQLLQYERTFDTPLEKAKYLINSFCQAEYEIDADFSDLHDIGIAYTTLTDDELPIQVTADLVDYKIIYEFDGEIYNTEQYDSIEDMTENGLTGLDFSDLVYVPDEIIEQHTQQSDRYKTIYMTLSRCKQDCDYAINTGDEARTAEGLNKYMFGGSVDTCINTMHEMYSKLPDDAKPEWLSSEDIDSYEQQLHELIRKLDGTPKQGSVVLVSAEINGEISYYRLPETATTDSIMRIAATITPLSGYENIGIRLSEVEYAEIQQSSDFMFSVELDFDNDKANLYSVNGGKGGLSEGDRTDDSILFDEFVISGYRLPYTGLGAEKVTINAEDAISMWENGFPVYYNNEAVPKYGNTSDGFDRSEVFSDEKTFTVAFGDLKQQNMIDSIASYIHEIDAAMAEDEYIDVKEFIDTDEDNAFNWNNNLNVYQNVEKALVERNFRFLDDYLSSVHNENGSIRADMARDVLVEYNNYTPPTKEYKTIIDIPEYNFSVDLKEIDELYLKDDYSYYEGGTDSDGHERMDNYSRHTRSITVQLDAYGSAIVSDYDDKGDFGSNIDSEYDLSDSNEAKELNKKIYMFIQNSTELSVTSKRYDETKSYRVHETDRKSFAAGPIVDGVQVYEALAAEIDRGTGFVNGKIRVQDFYEKKNPTIKELADFLKKEYGIGGHSGDGNISMVDYNRSGITFSFENGERFRHSWTNVAYMTLARLEGDTYLSTEQKAERQALKHESDDDTNINDIEQLTDELNAQTLSDVEVGDILLIREPETGEAVHYRIDTINDNFMVTMSRVADSAGNDYTDTGLATKSIINGHWKETLLDENTDFPIVRYTKNYQEELKQQQNSDDVSINNVQERKHKRASRAEMLYREFIAAFPAISDGTHIHERYGKMYDEYSENDAFEPLSIESLGDNTYAFMTWYVQNGDLMRDPDFVFTLDHEKHELHVLEYQMDGVPSVGTVYENVVLEGGMIDTKLQAALEENFRMTLRNAVDVGRELSSYTEANGEVHELDSEEEITVKPEMLEIHDQSAYYREILNEFSEKHDLGELNLTPNDSGFHITEKFQDGFSAPIWYISKNMAAKPLTQEELIKELNAYEAAADREGVTVSDYGYRQDKLKNHGGKTELPPVQDKLPEIKYADNPFSKIRDNITAIKEMQRIEAKENRGEYPFDEGRNDYYGIDACMERLRRYSGWGGVSQVFDERYSSLSSLREQLKTLLTPEEYAAARSSTLTSHYTPQVIIDEMYKTIRNMGIPDNSRILEPSCGTGNFISRMPRDMGTGGIVGVELDSITAKIAKYLNVPKKSPYSDKTDKMLADTRDIKILNCGFEHSNLENNSFDVVIGNVPFGDFKLNDPDYVNDWLIHDAFFRKALDKVAPGGVVAFISSSGTLDKKNPKIREQLAMKADLIGAVRLPNNAFADADTKVTADIIFLQKRKTPLNVYDPKPDWCYTMPVEVGMVGKKYEGETRTAYINSYFANNPQMILGTMKQTTHFDMLTCEPYDDKILQEQLEIAFRQLNAKISIDKRERSNLERSGLIEPWGKSFTYQIKDDKVYYNLGNAMEEVTGSQKAIEKLKLLCELRDTTRELLNRQQTYVADEELIPLRNKLNADYDRFVKTNGNLTSKGIKKIFHKDSDYPILSALEKIDPETKEVTKADIFTKRTVSPVEEVVEVDTAEAAMQVSLDRRGKIDIPYMATLLHNKYDNTELSDVMEYVTGELLDKGHIFRDPEKIAAGKPYAEIVDRSEYLCGNVRRKLVMAQDAASHDSSYEKNVEALREVIPEDIGAAEISADIGCTWIDTEDYEEFMRHLSGRTLYDSRNFSLRFSEITGKFTIENAHTRQMSKLNTNEISTYGSEDMNMYYIFQNLLNQQKIQVFDYFPDPNNPNKNKSVLNKNKTQVAQAKAKAIKQKFSEWIFATEERKEKYVKRYNEKFNCLVGRSYNGEHLTFVGMASDFKLRPHQLDCVARTIYGGNTLAAHCVGAGKSAVIAASVMKKKELGLIHKACVVVPKPLTEQTEREWRTSFPDAKLLVIDNKDLSDEKKRELFTARVATGDYDAIIMSQEQFDKLPMSDESRLRYLLKRKSELIDMLTQKKSENGRRDPSVKELELALKLLEAQIEAIINPKSKARAKDTLLHFETLGFDYLVVDEAHAYKNGAVLTKMGEVSGVNTRESGRAGDMQMKCDYFNSEFGNGHILFATGTPVSNSMTELYVMTRYLRLDLLEDCGCARFDDWAATFGQIKTQNKKTATGELKLKTCFAGFKNRPELIKMYKEFADLKTLDQLDYLNPPKIKGGKPQIVEVEATPEQREIVKDFARRGRDIMLGNVRPDEDNLLKITGEARLVGLGNQAVASVWLKNNGILPEGFVEDDKSGKIDACVRKVAEIYKSRYDNKAVQIIFSDIAVNGEEGKFSAYDYLKTELVNQGVKENEIVFAPKSDAKNRADIFRDINEAQYRIVIASTGTLGTGANIQKNLYALHHLDIPWRPSDFEQREGRIVRQGNKNDEVEIYNYVTKGTLDSYLYQGVTDKARGIAQLWNDTCISRTSEDIDEKVLTFGELEAAAEGNPKLRQYSELKNRIDELQVVRAEYNRETTRVERNLKELPDKIEAKIQLISGAEKDKIIAQKMKTGGRIETLKFTTHDNKKITDRKEINNYLADKIQLRITQPLEKNPAFRIGDFTVSVESTSDRSHPTFVIKGERNLPYRIEVGVGENTDNCQRLINLFDKGIEKQIENDTESVQKMRLDLEQAKERVETPFPSENEFVEVTKALEELEAELSAGGYLDNGEEFAGTDDYGECETERLENEADYDENDLTQEEYNSSI